MQSCSIIYSIPAGSFRIATTVKAKLKILGCRDECGQAPRSRSKFYEARLSTLVIVADANGTLSASTVGPVATNLGGGVAVLASSGDDPETDNSLGENIKNSVDDDLGADLNLPSATSSTPDTVAMLA
ncbi:unnamed protein product [Fusarium graminearum]|nr:unnamed protein product [Fusarium graminearum]